MPSVSVLYINDAIVGPHLELLRNICDPASRSRPHVTVRYFDKVDRTRVEHLKKQVDHINLIGPGAFGLEGTSPSANRVIFIRCESEDLEPLEHKPDFPASEFHITLYEGKSAKFARDLLLVLKHFRWRFRVPLPKGTKLSEIRIKPHGAKRPEERRVYREELKRLFRAITSKNLSETYLIRLPIKLRLELVRAICNHLEHEARDLPLPIPLYHDLSDDSSDSTSQEVDLVSGSTLVGPSDVFITPPELAEDMAKYAVGLLDPEVKTVDFGDPAVGIGVFYQALRQVLPAERIASAIGIEIDPRMAAAAYRKWAGRGLSVRNSDYLHMELLPHRNLILANPPYLRHQQIPRERKEKLRERASVVMGKRVNARAGQYVYFLLLSHQWMEPGAVAVWLIPSEFMQTGYGVAIREYLTEKVELVRVHRFKHDDPQFETAFVLPSVIAFRNRRPTANHVIVLTVGGTLSKPIKRTTIHINELRKESTWSIPRRITKGQTPPALKIGDLFTVRRGIATGANNFFILKREHARDLGIPDFALRPILPKARTLSSDVVNREPDGYPSINPQLSLLDCNLSEDQVAAQYPKLIAYLNTAKGLGILDRNLIRHRHPWYKQEHRDPSLFLCTYMGRGGKDHPPLRIILNKSDAVATNTYIMMYPREPLMAVLKDRPLLIEDLFMFLKEAAEKNIIDSARIHAGGLQKIEPGELLRVHLTSNPPWLCSAMGGDHR